MNNKNHLSIEGLNQIINIKASMNIGLSNILKENFNSIVPIEKPFIITEYIPDPNWIAGFVNGEGTFDVKIYKSKNNIGFAVQLRFRIPQHERDTKLIELLIKYFGAGVIEKHTKFPAVTLVLVKFSHITEKIIPFFETYPLFGQKKLDYFDWCKIAKLMIDGSHLTIDGLEKIRKIKVGMNKGRKK
jgi:LAGLIDADG endonuclease.